VQFVLQRSRAAARRLLAASIIYLPLFFALSATLRRDQTGAVRLLRRHGGKVVKMPMQRKPEVRIVLLQSQLEYAQAQTKVCRKCAVRFEPLCANSAFFDTSFERFRAGLSNGKLLILKAATAEKQDQT
jgi:hypothetical protein